MQSSVKYNTVVLLGPTAVGKTAIGVRLAEKFGWEIISADSRQVYKGLDIGSGKDINEYEFDRIQEDGSVRHVKIEHHLIDRVTLETEYNVFNFQQDFYSLFDRFSSQGKMSFVVGGTGMYIDAVVRSYPFITVPKNEALRKELSSLTLEDLGKKLISLKGEVHNKTDLLDRERTTRAIEIAVYMQTEEAQQEVQKQKRNIIPFVIGTTLPRDILRKNIRTRLYERADEGLIEEVENLHKSGWSWERLERLGLEYRFVSEYLENKISSKEEMLEKLFYAISQFAKRQETWFRGMERKGVPIHWLPLDVDKEVRYRAALDLLNS